MGVSRRPSLRTAAGGEPRGIDLDSARAGFRPIHSQQRFAIAIIGALVGVAAIVSAAAHVWEPARADFVVDQASARAAIRGADPYGSTIAMIRREIPEHPRLSENFHNYPNWHTPVRIALQSPLAGLSLRWAAIIWLILEAVAFVLAMMMFGAEMRWPRAVSFAGASSALALPLLQSELRGGQVHMLLLLLAVLSWKALKRQLPIRAGGWMGLAIATKVFPGLFFAPLIGQRRPRSIAFAAAMAAVATGLAWPRFGSLGFFKHIGEGIDTWRLWPWNLSWQGVGGRLGVPVPLLTIGSLLLLALAVWPRVRVTGDPYWAAVPVALLALPIAWSTYLICAIPWLLLGCATKDRSTRIVFVTILALVLIDVPSTVSYGSLAAAVTPIALGIGVAMEKGRRTISL